MSSQNVVIMPTATKLQVLDSKEKRTYCGAHCAEGMLNISWKQFPYKCHYNECKNNARFRFEGKKCTYCGTHHVEVMINLSLKRYQDDKYKKEARFGFKGKKPAYCFTLRMKGIRDFSLKQCEHNQFKNMQISGLKERRLHTVEHIVWKEWLM